jgi:hypothetical protein
MCGYNPSSVGNGFPNFSMKNGGCIFKEQNSLCRFGFLKKKVLFSLEKSVTNYPVTYYHTITEENVGSLYRCEKLKPGVTA